MAILLSPVLNEQQFDSNGDPLAGGFIYTYLAGTTTPVTTYKTSTGTAHSNPIVLDSAGYYPNGTQLWLDSGFSYKFEVQDSLGAVVRTIDNITPINDTVSSVIDQWVIYSNSAITYTSATTFTVAGDQTQIFQVGRRIKTENTSGTVYSTITASSYGAPNTSITVQNDTGTVLDSGLSSVSYGLLSPLNPSLARIQVSNPGPALTVNQLGSGPAISADQIKFPAVQRVSTDPNILDDYQEGDWTPVFNSATGSFGAITYDIQNGKYTKIGNCVELWGQIGTDSVALGTAAGDVRIGGIPFTADTGVVHSGSISFSGAFGGDVPSGCLIDASANVVALYYRVAANGVSTPLDVTDLGVGANTNRIYFHVSYRTAL